MAARFSSPAASLFASRPAIHASFEWLGHLAVWVGLYVGGCVVMSGLLLHGRVSLMALFIAIPTTMGTYLVDRVGPWSGRSDPADRMAHPDRVSMLLKFDSVVRLAAVVCILSAAVATMFFQPMAVLAVLGAPIGVWIYSHRGRLPRPKDSMVVKNLFVAISITVLVLLLDGHGSRSSSLIAVGIFLLLNIFADAMICDIDDSAADARFGTRTIANTLGSTKTWRLAILLQSMAFFVTIIAAAEGLMAWFPVLLMGVTSLSLTFLIRSLRVRRVKDLVDLKLPMAVSIVWILISMTGSGLLA